MYRARLQITGEPVADAEGLDAFHLADLSDVDRAKLMGGTASRIYNWSPPKA